MLCELQPLCRRPYELIGLPNDDGRLSADQRCHPKRICHSAQQRRLDANLLNLPGGPPNPPFDFYGQATRGIAVDGAGDAYVTGGTLDTGFPVTSGAAQTTFGGAVDCYVTKLNPTATAPLLYSTFLGGSGTEDCWSIALLPGCSSNCNAYVNGSTSSNDLPTTTGAAQSSIGGIENGLEAELSADGSQFLYLTYLGGRYNGSFNIAVDSSGDAYATGFTSTDDFPTLDPTQIAPAPNGILFSSTNGFSTIAQSCSALVGRLRV